MLIDGLIFLLVTFVAQQLWRAVSRAAPDQVAVFAARASGYALILLAGFLVLTGRELPALLVAAMGVFVLGRGAMRPAFARILGNVFGKRRATLRTAMIELETIAGDGSLDGIVLAGEFVGARLNDLSREQSFRIYKSAVQMDRAGARLLEAYFDRRFPGWRHAGNGDDNARRSGAHVNGGPMSEDEAYQILGLGKGAARRDILRAHREMMKKWHPDLGGATEVAARLNQARDVLIRIKA
ncbi:MAG: DnaJ domain-containing protein [Hyphomicrobiales bacterium]|nr:DnaJ domain-containing protein [Hyphomicrobiales bacterium]